MGTNRGRPVDMTMNGSPILGEHLFLRDVGSRGLIEC